ncbi:MAG TPA: DUF2059 domain-containing protein [Candidatus Acidoferrales bacterium]
MKALIVATCILLGALSVQAHPQQPSDAATPPAPQSAESQVTAPDAAPPGGKINPAKASDIQHLLELTGMRSIMAQTVNSMEDNLKPAIVDSLPPGDYREKLSDLFFEKFNSKLLIDMAAAAYDKYLSDDDIKGLIQFYQTPLGHKTLTVLPKLTAELQTDGMKLGQDVGQESMSEVLAEHPDLAKALQDASH